MELRGGQTHHGARGAAAPPLMAPDPGAYAIAKQVHFSFAWLSIVLVLGHIAAALKHHLIDKDSVLLSMLPNKFSDKQTRR